MLYRFRYCIVYTGSEHSQTKDVFAETRIEADTEIEGYTKNKNAKETFQYMTESGTTLEDITAGERCLIQSFGVLNETTVSKVTKNFIYVEMLPDIRFRRDGSEIDKWGKRQLYRYDKKQYDDYWKGRADRERLNNIKRLNWLEVPDELFDEIYAKLEAIEKVPHVENTPVRYYSK